MKFEAAAREYIARLKQSGGRGIAWKEGHLRRHLVPYFGERELSSITAYDLEVFAAKRLGEFSQAGGRHGERRTNKMVRPASINRELSTIGHLLNKAVEWGWLDRKPRIPRLREGPGRTSYLNPEAAQRLLAEMDGNTRLFTLIGLSTAMRKREVLTLRWEFIDLPRRTIHLPNAKAGPRTVPMTQGLADYLGTLPRTSPWLFPSKRSKSGHITAIEKTYRKAVIRAGLDPKLINRHTLRHSAITGLIQAGVDLVTVMKVSGHATLAMVQRYAHADDAQVKGAMDKLQDRFRI